MSRKQLKDLWKQIPNKTPEQVDAYNKFYGETKNDAFKTFDTEEEFNTYKTSITNEATKPLKEKISETELKPKMKEAKQAFIDAGHKESMWKYIQNKSMTEADDGTKTFNDKSLKKAFWTKTVSELEDKTNYLSETKKEIPKKLFTRTSQKSADSDKETGKTEVKSVYF